jgi:hypothetical protein
MPAKCYLDLRMWTRFESLEPLPWSTRRNLQRTMINIYEEHLFKKLANLHNKINMNINQRNIPYFPGIPALVFDAVFAASAALLAAPFE